MHFRKDINGLRAIAVIAVVIFHFFPELIPGGFAGVDVFFVISGYLMTGIIFRGIEQKNFSLSYFYIARANRIIPTLAVVCSVMLLFGWFYLNPIDYSTLARHSLASLAFVSNIVYCFGAGYFGEKAHTLWLLHTWSLSVEWQFYIFYPIVLVVFAKFLSFKNLKYLVVMATILSFLISAGFTPHYKDPAFFLLPTRAWEMLLGGLAFLYPMKLDQLKSKLVEITGLLLILATYFLADETLVWPGYLALAPVLGTFFIIQAQQNESFLTSNAMFQKLGSWSYSIYLWHWPLAVFIYYHTLPMTWSLLGMTASVVLGYLSYRFIEKIRFKNNFTDIKSYLTCYPILATMVLAAISAYIYLNNGIYFRFTPAQSKIYQQASEALEDWHYPDANLRIAGLDIRFIPGNTDENILFIGASHIMQTYPFVEEHSKKYNVYYLTQNGCLPTSSFRNPKWSCDNLKNYQKLLSEVKFKKIIMSAYSFDSYLPKNTDLHDDAMTQRINEIDEMLANLKQHAQEFYLLLPEPRGRSFDPLLAARYNLPLHLDVQQVREDFKNHTFIMSRLKNLDQIKIIDPINFLCTDFCEVRDENGFFYRDDNHMRPWYARKALEYLREAIE